MSIVLQYENTTLQYSDNGGNISHQGVLGSNISGTAILSSTFPTTSTGDSLGHYHYTEATTNAIKFLNVSGTGSGGHQFWNANDTNTPIKYFELNRDKAIIDTRIQSSDGKTLLNFTTPYNSLTLKDSTGTIINTVEPTQILIGDYAQNLQGGITTDRLYVNNQNTNTITNIYAGLVQIGNTPDLATLSYEQLQIKKRDGTLTSTLNNTSLNITNTTTTKTAILTDSNLTFNGVSYAQNQISPTLIYSSPLIYADGIEPAKGLAIRNTYGYSGWYFKNSHGTTGGKINWYFPAQTQTSTTVADLKGIAISFFNGQTVSNDDTLFITVLTNLTGTNDYAPGFFHSSMTYVFNQAITPIANTNYQGVCIIDKNLVPFNFETQIQFEPSTINNPRGTYAQNDTILAISIGTNSASVKNSVELVVNKLNLIYSNFTQSYLLVPP